jgi:hypothetical protein
MVKTAKMTRKVHIINREGFSRAQITKDEIFSNLEAWYREGVVSPQEVALHARQQGNRVAPRPIIVGGPYHITVRSGRTLSERVDACIPGRQHWRKGGVTEKRFRLSDRTSDYVVVCEVVSFVRQVFTHVVISEMQAQLGLRRPTIEEALAFGETFPAVQQENHVSGIVGLFAGSDAYISLEGNSSHRHIKAFPSDTGRWTSSYRFLGVREVVTR